MIKELFTKEEYDNLLKEDNLLEKSIKIAERLFKDAKDKGGKPYFEHLSFVSDNVTSQEEKTIGIMHDSIEDYHVSVQELLDLGYPQQIVEGIVTLTRKENEEYNVYIERIIKSNNLNILNVKLADLKNNMDISRIDKPTVKDFARVEDRYRPAYIKIENKIRELEKNK